MAVRYNVTNPIDTMMKKIVSPVAIVDSNGAIVVYLVIIKNPKFITQTTIYISEFRGLELVSRITFAVFRPFKSQFKSRMPEEAFDSSADDNNDISLT
jgi:hypothetical protein